MLKFRVSKLQSDPEPPCRRLMHIKRKSETLSIGSQVLKDYQLFFSSFEGKLKTMGKKKIIDSNQDSHLYFR